jgi:hypothetical protein
VGSKLGAKGKGGGSFVLLIFQGSSVSKAGIFATLAVSKHFCAVPEDAILFDVAGPNLDQPSNSCASPADADQKIMLGDMSARWLI